MQNTNQRGASTVTGAILLVGVVVILASIISVFALGTVEDVDSPIPQAGFDFDWDKPTRTLTITHQSGETFDQSNTERLEVVIRDADDTGQNDFLIAKKDWASTHAGGFPISSGDSFTITGNDGGGDLDVKNAGTNVNTPDNPPDQTHEPEIDDPVRIIWYGPDGRSSVIVEYTIKSGED